MAENNRRYARHDIQIDVSLALAENEPQTMRTRDVSEGGMFLITNAPSDFPLGEMVHIQYNNPLDNNAETEVDAIIVRLSIDGVGVAFIAMDAF
ncbi:MAG: PilZ domain-containing protein [Gammaproteobacteria bacterium]|nr:PilZ domain-containing protein [Gammaproteobacteria bacterium]MCW8924219.1 PilZ domain-containing protein [Gammaproteobacteria bacterium]